MGRNKNPNKKTTEEAVREALAKDQAEFKASRMTAFEAPKSSVLSARESFSSFWASAKKEYNRPKDIEEILWAHLVASGHDKPDLFEKGLKHFGLTK